MRPRVQSANRAAQNGTLSAMHMTGHQGSMPSQTEMGQINGITVGRTILQRPAKSAANKYRHII
jgi:hypothetical protein